MSDTGIASPDNTGAGDDPGTAAVSFRESIQSEDLRGHDALKSIADVDGLAQEFITLKEAQPTLPDSIDGYAYELPEGVSLNEEESASFKQIALDSGFTADQYSAMMKFDLDRQNKANEAVEARATEASDALKTEYGDKYDENLELAKSVLKRYKAEELMGDKDLGSNPAFFSLLVAFAGSVSEGNLETGGSPGGADTRERGIDGSPMLDFSDMDKK